MRNVYLPGTALIAAVLSVATTTTSGQPINYQPYVFKAFAGPTEIQTVDGTNSAARFYLPQGVALDSSSNVYVTEFSTVRKITADGVVTTIAGVAGMTGTNNGPGTTALFNGPAGVAIDSSNNVFVTDFAYNTVRKIDTNGVVTTFAGQPFAVTPFNGPVGIAIDSANTLYVADQNNNRIQTITANGSVSTLAGKSALSGTNDGAFSSALFAFPQGVAVVSNLIFVADTANNTIRKISYGTGTVSTLAGAPTLSGSVDGTGNAARFSSPTAIAISQNTNLFVVDSGNHVIRKVTASGVVTTVAGIAGVSGATDGGTNIALFNHPFGLAATTVGGITTLFISDYGNCSIRTVTIQASSTSVSTFAGPSNSMVIGTKDGPSADARFYLPTGVAAANSGNAYVADRASDTIRKIDSDGVVTTLAGTAGVRGTNDAVGSSALFAFPQGVAVDVAENVYVADGGNQTIRKIFPDGTVITLAGKPGSPGSTDGTNSGARFNLPTGVAVDSSNTIYVADNFNNTIRKVTPEGVVTTLAGKAGSRGTADGTNSAARFFGPRAIAIDAALNLFVTDSINSSIRKITPDGTVSTFAGLSGSFGFVDGVSTNARFSQPLGITIDNHGNLYVTDYNNIRKITPDAVVTTVGGSGGVFGFVNAAGGDARFNAPSGIAVDQTGALLIADFVNNAIRRGVPLALSVQQQGSIFTVSWPDGSGYLLEQSSPLGINWTPVSGTMQTNNETVTVSASIPGNEAYFRLRNP